MTEQCSTLSTCDALNHCRAVENTGNHNLGSRRRERFAKRRANSTAAAGHDCNFVIQPSIHDDVSLTCWGLAGHLSGVALTKMSLPSTRTAYRFKSTVAGAVRHFPVTISKVA